MRITIPPRLFTKSKYMKKITIVLTILLFSINSVWAQVAINEDGSDAHASAILDVKSTSKGFLPPQMTASEIALIASPAAGLLVFNTDDNHYYFYDDGAGEWKEIDLGTNTVTPIPTVYNPITGETWMDRNLGATRVAISGIDAQAYGDLYQWGRATEGHESRTSGTTTTNATTAVPNDGNTWDGLYIAENTTPHDWLIPADNTLWDGTGGTNNPCPSGFRLPTHTEWVAERDSWSSNDRQGAFNSPLKLTTGGYRTTGFWGSVSINKLNDWGRYWSSSINGINSQSLYFNFTAAGIIYDSRMIGNSIRCIKD